MNRRVQWGLWVTVIGIALAYLGTGVVTDSAALQLAVLLAATACVLVGLAMLVTGLLRRS